MTTTLVSGTSKRKTNCFKKNWRPLPISISTYLNLHILFIANDHSENSVQKINTMRRGHNTFGSFFVRARLRERCGRKLQPIMQKRFVERLKPPCQRIDITIFSVSTCCLFSSCVGWVLCTHLLLCSHHCNSEHRYSSLMCDRESQSRDRKGAIMWDRFSTGLPTGWKPVPHFHHSTAPLYFVIAASMPCDTQHSAQSAERSSTRCTVSSSRGSNRLST